ncbi:uncharacterized protein LACBIDRAFT_315251 [Laccaria bicolor S238N-H82]|uniref:Predicted protein n=1 Tax=Laccaria bicolor (strain S238N-H82 / ATCC MYA-4686) TaxID=486041 RepID=B0E065_LACBS|nr:uncharacterized protein LACBIDRAFT_315251 [Laccaria bicolor S238N-H82]EDQ99767.1 predicted protein [Laccaria bicolor S238N-H82]|eukprot:XP_001889603.1 predicted protein [Laccaria bicolor S238N-H82]
MNMDHYDDGGVMALVCHHDAPLFLATINTPGEQQKYAVSLIEHLFSLLPPTATVTILYDVACVLDRSLNFVSAPLHSHISSSPQASLTYFPKASPVVLTLAPVPCMPTFISGHANSSTTHVFEKDLAFLMGRAWSRRQHIWMLDRQSCSIGAELWDDLSDWIRQRLKTIATEENEVQKILSKCGVPVSELRTQWGLQKAAQLPIRAHAPACLKKELDAVLKLQTTIDTTNDCLKEKVEQPYASLNIQDSFPELEDIDLDFVKLLVLARDLKINIRKRAIGSFFEWDLLDQATGGRQHAIGSFWCVVSNTPRQAQRFTKTRKMRLRNTSQLFSGLF